MVSYSKNVIKIQLSFLVFYKAIRSICSWWFLYVLTYMYNVILSYLCILREQRQRDNCIRHRIFIRLRVTAQIVKYSIANAVGPSPIIMTSLSIWLRDFIGLLSVLVTTFIHRSNYFLDGHCYNRSHCNCEILLFIRHF